MGIGARELSPWQRAAVRLRPLAPAMAVCCVGLLPFTTCLSKIFFGIPCPACGLTRAGLCILSGDAAGATRFQPLALPLLALFVAVVACAPFASEERWRALVRWSTASAGVGLVAVWALRFAGLFGGPVP